MAHHHITLERLRELKNEHHRLRVMTVAVSLHGDHGTFLCLQCSEVIGRFLHDERRKGKRSRKPKKDKERESMLE